jgi:hypothetical protein
MTARYLSYERQKDRNKKHCIFEVRTVKCGSKRIYEGSVGKVDSGNARVDPPKTFDPVADISSANPDEGTIR